MNLIRILLAAVVLAATASALSPRRPGIAIPVKGFVNLDTMSVSWYKTPKTGFVGYGAGKLTTEPVVCTIGAHDPLVEKGKAGGLSVFAKFCLASDASESRTGWNIERGLLTVGMGSPGARSPSRTITFATSMPGNGETYGLRQIEPGMPHGMRFEFFPLRPLLSDVDQDGDVELVVWEGFVDSSRGEQDTTSGTVPWVYKFKNGNLVLDSASTRTLIGAVVDLLRTRFENRQMLVQAGATNLTRLSHEEERAQARLLEVLEVTKNSLGVVRP